jgi:hypothetical protein
MSEDEKKVNEIDEALEKERGDFSKRITEVISMINKIDNISEAQVLMLSARHNLVEKIAKYRSSLYKKRTSDSNYKKLRYEYYKTQHDVRYDYREINQFIESDMALRSRQTDLLENQVTFFSQCVDTLDRLGFSIKNKIQVEEFNHKNF